MIAKSYRWRKTALAAAALFCLWGTNASALSLGRITVLSALGEPLRAEIDIPDINAEESASLKAAVASPDVFRAAGLEYNPAMSGLQATLQRRSDGRSYIRLSSDKTVNDPFVDVILEASWASGRIVRDYTLLFDPPNLRQPAPAAPTPAQVNSAAVSARVALPTPSPAAAVTITRPPESVRTLPKPVTVAVASKPTPSGVTQVTVKAGDTASKIAATVKPANVSLDQMLVALLRANPDAFVRDNVNRVKSGAIMTVPTTEQANSTPAEEASRIIVAQSKDFNDFRRKLADNAPSSQMATADRKVSGSVQAKVEDKKPASITPDKLTLSKGAIQGKPPEDLLAKERNVKEVATRAAEIAKNISDINKLSAASSAVTLAASTPKTAKPLPVMDAPVAVVAPPGLPASAPTAASSGPAPNASAPVSTQPVATASAPQVVASAKRVVPAPAVPAAPVETSLIDGLIEDPLVPAGAVGLIALLAGLGIYRIRQRKKATTVDSAFMESRLQPESFFGASGGQSVDTNDGTPTGSSMVYSPSQMDTGDDVDPVAEADVYLAYGRDLQAEEILEEALRTNPGRLAIHQKLLEIFAKRRDAKRFEHIAEMAFKLTRGEGADWDRICAQGLSIDPKNVLYQPGGQPDVGSQTLAPTGDAVSLPEITGLDTTQIIQPVVTGGMDLDLDLDFSHDEEKPSSTSPTTPTPRIDFELTAEPPAARSQGDTGSIEFSLIDDMIERNDIAPPALEMPSKELPEASRDDPANQISLDIDVPVESPAQDLSMLEFDLGSLSLDLDEAADTESPTLSGTDDDPLVTKLALAEEFRAIGDDDGARALIEEVISEATGDMKIKAQRALSHL